MLLGERLHTYDALPFKGPVTCVEYHPFEHAIAMCGLGGRTVSVCLYKYNFHSNNAQTIVPHQIAVPPTTLQVTVPRSPRGKLQKAKTVDPSSRNLSRASSKQEREDRKTLSASAGNFSSSVASSVLVSAESSRMRKAIKKLETALKMKSLEQA